MGLDQAGDGTGRDEAARGGNRTDGLADEGQDLARQVDQEPAPESAGDAGAERPEVDYWGRVEEFERLWEQHIERWPGAPGGSDRDWSRPGDPPGSWRGEGGRYLSPEQNAEADRLIAALRAPEPAVTDVLRAIERDNPHGARLAGLKNCIKGDQRLKEKIVEKLAAKVGSSMADAVSTVNDAVRYTYCVNRDNYVPGYSEIERRLQSAAYQMTYRDNRWLDDNPQYRGINTRWVTPAGDRFELQFHTEESLYSKEHLTHRSYDRLRSLDTSRAEQSELKSYQRIVTDAIPNPDGIETLSNYGKEEPNER